MIDETGNVYGRLTVIGRAESGSKSGARWRCLCECGIETTVMGCHLRSGSTSSCGCFHRERLLESSRVGALNPAWKDGSEEPEDFSYVGKIYLYLDDRTGRWAARVNVRLPDGRKTNRSRTGATPEEAEQRLRDALDGMGRTVTDDDAADVVEEVRAEQSTGHDRLAELRAERDLLREVLELRERVAS
ncbi:hypothetical protein [Janibacter sp. Soil728]|uniref:hypothetical protein n=1 Tax=Janibacter sp. Soil728 TaxID=1736393 RepID=UPI0012E7F0F5|nr:hypothetical protein [Janibacter sp. Soil728]